MNGIGSGFGTWNPLAWTLLFLGIVVISVLIRSFGRKDYKKGTGQTKVFLSGNEEPEPERLHVRGDDLYWGMVEGLAAYYRRIQGLHTGILNDYLAWFIGVLGIVFILLILVR
jgi:hypothetical protein